MRDVIDGTSNVIGVGERAWELNLANGNGKAGCDAAIWAGSNGVNMTSPANAAQAVAILGVSGPGINNTTINAGNPNNQNACELTFSSQHTGGAHFLMMDGAVRFISENIDNSMEAAGTPRVINSTFEFLLSKNDGNPVGDF